MKNEQKGKIQTSPKRSREAALALLCLPDFFCELLAALKREGLVGEERNALAVFVVVVSRLLTLPLNLFVKGQSSSGKNFTVKRVLRLIPRKYVWEVTDASERAWNYMGGRLKHKLLFFQEESVAFGGKRHPARLLISENRIERLVTVWSEGQRQVKKQFTEGPVACIATTTKDQLLIDDETRNISIWADESTEQTARIVRAQVAERTPLTVEEIAIWHEVQDLLVERSKTPIELPEWFRTIAEQVWTGDVRIRRYFPAFLEACRTVSLIRSFNRKNQNAEPIRMRFSDYAITTLIFEDAFSQSLTSADERSVELRDAMSRISARRSGRPVSAQEIATELGLPLHEAYERIRLAVEQKLIWKANQPQRGNRKLYLPTERGVQFPPNPEQVFKEIADPGDSVKFVHPITGELVIYRA